MRFSLYFYFFTHFNFKIYDLPKNPYVKAKYEGHFHNQSYKIRKNQLSKAKKLYNPYFAGLCY